MLKKEPFSDPTVADSLRLMCKATRNRFHRKKKQEKKNWQPQSQGVDPSELLLLQRRNTRR